MYQKINFNKNNELVFFVYGAFSCLIFFLYFLAGAEGDCLSAHMKGTTPIYYKKSFGIIGNCYILPTNLGIHLFPVWWQPF